MIPEDVKEDIAAIVLTVVFNRIRPASGCVFYQVLGELVLKAAGINAKLVYGSMLYRAGPCPKFDVVSYCGPGNVGWFCNPGTLDPITTSGQGEFYGHCWLESRGELIDFPTREWQSYCSDPLRPIEWTAPPLPKFIWQEAEPLKSAWRESGKPELHHLWYGPMKTSVEGEAVTQAHINLVQTKTYDICQLAIPAILASVRSFELKQRLLEAAD